MAKSHEAVRVARTRGYLGSPDVWLLPTRSITGCDAPLSRRVAEGTSSQIRTGGPVVHCGRRRHRLHFAGSLRLRDSPPMLCRSIRFGPGWQGNTRVKLTIGVGSMYGDACHAFRLASGS